jgi:hypothetical protein
VYLRPRLRYNAHLRRSHIYVARYLIGDSQYMLVLLVVMYPLVSRNSRTCATHMLSHTDRVFSRFSTGVCGAYLIADARVNNAIMQLFIFYSHSTVKHTQHNVLFILPYMYMTFKHAQRGVHSTLVIVRWNFSLFWDKFKTVKTVLELIYECPLY